MSLVWPSKLFRNCLTNTRFSGRLFKFLIVYIKKVYVHIALTMSNESYDYFCETFKNEKSWYTFFCAPTHMSTYTTVHLSIAFTMKCCLCTLVRHDMPWCAQEQDYSLLLFPLKLTYINRGHPHYNLHSRRPWDKWFLDDNKRSKMNKVFRTLMQMCTRLNRCSYRGHVGKIFLDSWE